MTKDIEEIVMALRQAAPEERPALLAKLDYEQTKAAYREITGNRKTPHAKTDEEREAHRLSMHEQLLRALNAETALAPVRPEVGAVVRDEEAEADVEITAEILQADAEFQLRLGQAEYAVQRGLVDICRAVKDFRDAKGYLAHGFTSFKRFCDAGRLKVFGQTKSRRWAYQRIQMLETFTEKGVQLVAHLPAQMRVQLLPILNREGMEATLEELRENFELTYTGSDGAERKLGLPKSGADVDAWQDFIGVMGQRTAAAQAEAEASEDALVTEREQWRAERKELLDEIDRIKAAQAEESGRGEEILDQLVDAKELNPEQIAALQVALREHRERLRRLDRELADAHHSAEQIGARLDERLRIAAGEGTLKKARTWCNEALRLHDRAREAVQPLVAIGPDLPDASLELLHDTAVRMETQARELIGMTIEWRGGAREG